MNFPGSEAMDAFTVHHGTSSRNQTPDLNQFQVGPNFSISSGQTQKQRQGMQQSAIQQTPMAQWAQANQSTPLSFHAQQPQLPWPNQAQQLQNAILQMSPFNMPLLSQQIIQEAVAMSTPVDATDEPILLTALLNAKKTGRNFKEALNSLHGNKGHSASLWKDYYLEHKERVDGWIDMCIKKESGLPLPSLSQLTTQMPVATVKKPSPAFFKRGPSPTLSKGSRLSHSVPSSTLVTKRAQKKPTTAAPVNIEGRRRSTMNSLSVPEPVFGEKLPAPNASIKVPAPPSRSPSPPTLVVPQGRGNRFTKGDREFFVKFLGWRLKQEASLNRQELCDMLAEKAPHHSSASWYAFWSNNHDLPDKILAAARGERDGSQDLTDDDEEDLVPSRRPNYKEDTTSEDDVDQSQEEDEDEDSDDDDDVSDTEPVRHYSEVDMGGTGSGFNEADMYITAKYIASIADWDRLKSKDRWDPFYEKHPQRSAKAWAELYRKHGKNLLKLSKRIKLENRQSSIMTQCARPSKALPGAKRRADNESEEMGTKRSRLEGWD